MSHQTIDRRKAKCTAAIHQALAAKGLLPSEHFVDAASIDAELLVRSRQALEMDLVGPPRPNPTWQGKVEGGYTIDRFEVDWKDVWTAPRVQERLRAKAPVVGCGHVSGLLVRYV